MPGRRRFRHLFPNGTGGSAARQDQPSILSNAGQGRREDPEAISRPSPNNNKARSAREPIGTNKDPVMPTSRPNNRPVASDAGQLAETASLSVVLRPGCASAARDQASLPRPQSTRDITTPCRPTQCPSKCPAGRLPLGGAAHPTTVVLIGSGDNCTTY